MPLEIVKTPAEVQLWTLGCARSGQEVALVPTMGFLHEGHLALIREAKSRAPRVAVSLFVNPTQFGPNEDLSRYPRDLEGDSARCREAGVDLLFAPEVSALYPPGDQTFVEVGELSQGLCGAKRPGHFRGVATVVTKLFGIFRPAIAVFGEKDYQQLQIIQTLNRDLSLRVHVVGVPTVRESDGVALSSRNSLLNADERRHARALIQGLRTAESLAQQGERSAKVLTERVRSILKESSVREDYVALVDGATLKPIERLNPETSRLLVAGFVGKTRLIDNLAL